MRKLPAALLALIFVFLLSNFITTFTTLENPETAIVARVIDGDTLELDDGRIIRLVNINAPEKNTPWSSQATDFLKEYENASIDLVILGVDKYHRILGQIYAPEYLNAELVSLGLASKFLVHEGEVDDFAELERSAIEKERGIWKHSRYWDCFEIGVSPKKEEVSIQKLCDVSLKGFLIKDESRKIYKFPLSGNTRVTLNTFNGSNSQDTVFWNLEEDVWNDNRDTVYLFDPEGYIAGYFVYGY